jgi:uncharacterized protein (UPF0332 family)
MGEKYSRDQFAAKLGANGDPKLNAAADFAARLLNSPVGERVARIVLFGSVARGAARPESDIDLLVFSASDPDPVREAVIESALDAGMAWGQSVEPLVLGLSDLRVPSGWFVYRTLQVGKEVYRMNERLLRLQEARGWWELARQYLKEARDSAERGNYRLAVDGAYNAAELATKGLLALKVKDLPSTHGGIVQVFGREYVAPGIAAREFSSGLGRGLELRNQARYVREAVITSDHVQLVAATAELMMKLLDEQLSLAETEGGEA